MELWIRSQDRMKLVKVDNISYMDMAEDYEKEVYSLWNDCKGILGKYETKERALEVLDEIQELLMPKIKILHNKIKEEKLQDFTRDVILQPMIEDIQVQQASSYVYEMPKE